MSGGIPVLLGAIVSAILFTLGLHAITHPRTAVRGQMLVAVGIAVQLIGTILTGGYDVLLFFLAMALGAGSGALLAERTVITNAPGFLAGILAFGALAAALVGGAALRDLVLLDEFDPRYLGVGATILARSGVSLAILLGATTFGAALASIGKVQGTARAARGSSRPGAMAIGGLALAAGMWFIARPSPGFADLALGALSFLFGILLARSIRAEPPALLALLSAGTGFSVLAAGFALRHNGLLTAGAIVASASLAFAELLARGGGRSLADLAFGGLGGGEADLTTGPLVRTTSAEEVAMILDGVSRVVLVPGYGLARSQGQHALRDLANALRGQGAVVDYAIHPVAGCVPGQMNLLLGEADVPEAELKEIEEIDLLLSRTDVAIVVGAGDSVNPEARTNPKSPLAGMPVVEVGKAGTVVVVKRSLDPGSSGVTNSLFTAENTLMLFGDGKKMLQELVRAVKENAK